VTVVVYGASGHELEAHDLHVGAALRVLGCPITLRKVSAHARAHASGALAAPGWWWNGGGDGGLQVQ
jgi:hypothetical protein